MTYEEMTQTLMDIMPTLRSHESVQQLSNVTAGEFAALSYLAGEHNGATAGELTSAIRVGSSRTTAILQSMEKKGLLKRESDPDDGRRVLAFLTEKGAALEKTQRELAMNGLCNLLKYLGETDAESLLRILKRVLDYQNPEQE